MILTKLKFQFRKKYFRVEQMVFQALYKAQDLGFYDNIYDGDLIPRFTDAVVRADLFSCARNFQAALRVMNHPKSFRDALRTCESVSLATLAAPSSLDALVCIAEAHEAGWNLVIEDCSFANRFVRPVALAGKGRVDFASYGRIPREIRAKSGNPAKNPTLFITFPDRQFDSINTSLPVRMLGQEFLLSMTEPLLHHSMVDRVWRLNGEIQTIERPGISTQQITGGELARIAQEQAEALGSAIQDAPENYLGWESLFSRARKHFELVNANRRNLFQCLLRHWQMNGLPLNQEGYSLLIDRLDRRHACSNF